MQIDGKPGAGVYVNEDGEVVFEGWTIDCKGRGDVTPIEWKMCALHWLMSKVIEEEREKSLTETPYLAPGSGTSFCRLGTIMDKGT